MTRRGWVFGLPAAVFALLAWGFYVGLGIDSNVLPSALIDQPAPDFALPPLPGGASGFSSADLQGRVSLVNVFASWCTPCRTEHPVLNLLAKTKRVAIYGIDYKRYNALSKGFIFRSGRPFESPDETIADDIAAQSRHLKVGDTVTFAGNPSTRRERHMYVTNVLLPDKTEIVLRANAKPRWSPEHYLSHLQATIDPERAAGDVLDPEQHAVAVLGAERDRLQDQQVEDAGD